MSSLREIHVLIVVDELLHQTPLCKKGTGSVWLVSNNLMYVCFRFDGFQSVFSYVQSGVGSVVGAQSKGSLRYATDGITSVNRCTCVDFPITQFTQEAMCLRREDFQYFDPVVREQEEIGVAFFCLCAFIRRDHRAPLDQRKRFRMPSFLLLEVAVMWNILTCSKPRPR